MTGNFVTEGGEDVVLSTEMLSSLPTVAPPVLEVTSLLLGEEDRAIKDRKVGIWGKVLKTIGVITLMDKASRHCIIVYN